MLEWNGSCLAGSRIYLAETHCRPFNFEFWDYYMQKKSVLSSLGLLLGTPCSYLFNLFRIPVITLCTTMFKFRKFLFLQTERTCVFYVGTHSVFKLRVILREVIEVFALLCCYAAYVGSRSPTFRDKYPSHTQEPKGSRRNKEFLRVLWFSHVHVMPPMLHCHLHLYISLTRRTNGRILGILLKSVFSLKQVT
jgi:hypothetical protein